jgi:hypothetical protein
MLILQGDRVREREREEEIDEGRHAWMESFFVAVTDCLQHCRVGMEHRASCVTFEMAAGTHPTRPARSSRRARIAHVPSPASRCPNA